MSHTDCTFTISKSQTVDSLHPQSTKDTTQLTSGKFQPTQIKISSHTNRRKAILPTPHKPKNEQDLPIMNSKNNSCNDKQMADVLYEFEYTTNQSFVHDSKVLFNGDPNGKIQNSVVYKTSYRPNKLDESHKLDQPLNQRENGIDSMQKNF